MPQVDQSLLEIAMDDPTTPIVHTTLGGGLMAAILGWLPQLLAILVAIIGAIYYLICIWESKTVQHYMNNRRMVRKAKRVAKLRAKERIIVAQLEALETVRSAKSAAAEMVLQATSEAAKLLATETSQAEIKNVPPRDAK